MKLGAHCSTAGGFYMAAQRAAQIGAEVCQIFVKNNKQWFGKAPLPADAERLASEAKAAKLGRIFGHAGYLINLAGPASNVRETSIRSLIQEIEFADLLGVPFLVLHPGAHLGTGEDAGVRQAVAGLDEVIAATSASKVRIALENTAGQGSCLGHKFEHLAAIFEGVKVPSRLGVCLDTAHLFAAGFDIRTPSGWDQVIGQVSRMIGIRQILAFHLNDSKTDLGSRVDRHEHIGEGRIGKKAFGHIVNDARFKNHPACLETPKSEDLHEDVKNLKVLFGLRKQAAGKGR